MVSIWEGVGTLWGVSWALLGTSGRFLGVKNRAFVKHWSKMGSKRPFGSILVDFGRVLGGFWEGLGKDLDGYGGFWASYGQILEAFGEIWPCWGRFYN